jgi:lysophospholipase L1-like esterase
MKIIFFGDSLTEGIPGIGFYDILKDNLPNHNLINCGRGGDTVPSLYGRMKRMKLSENYDIAFLWIGTNDIIVNISFKQPIIKSLSMQFWSKNIDEFKSYYNKTLEIITKRTGKVFAVSPAIIGEDLNNKWNLQIQELSFEIKKLIKNFENVEFIDIHKEFASMLKSKKPSDYILKSISKDVIAAWFLHDSENIEEESKKRGLHLTIDGVHLNKSGACIVADKFLRSITNEP